MKKINVTKKKSINTKEKNKTRSMARERTTSKLIHCELPTVFNELTYFIKFASGHIEHAEYSFSWSCNLCIQFKFTSSCKEQDILSIFLD